jgi:hypothetical protein
MNWYSLTKKSMPLPRAKGYPTAPASDSRVDQYYFEDFEETK